jgi:hypothetical protein
MRRKTLLARTTLRLGAIIVVLATVACERAGPTTPMAPPAARRDLVTPPQGQGAMVIIDSTQVYFFNFDPAHQLLSAHVPSDICLTGDFNVGDRMIVTTPSAIEQRLVKVQDGDSRVAVYHATSLNDLSCAFLLGPNKVAEGTVRHTQTFSNASFAAHWAGWIEGVDGTPLHLSETYQLTASALDPNNPDLWSENVTRILLTL